MHKPIFRAFVALTCFLLGVTSFFGWYFYQYYRNSNHENLLDASLSKMEAYRDGKSLAEADVSLDKLKVKIYGMGVMGDVPELYKEHLWSDYGIELDRVAGCVVTEELIEGVRGYNEISVAEIERRYGKGIMEKVHQQAEMEVKERQKSK